MLALLVSAAFAAPPAEVPDLDVLTDDQRTERDPPNAPIVRAPVKDDERRASWPLDLPGTNPGFLTDKAVYLSQCHGWIWFDSLDSFSLQRGNVHDTVEDIHNPEGMDQFLIAYLENAGAAVYPVKERDMQRAVAYADNDGIAYRESGDGFVAGGAGFRDAAPYPYGENPFTGGTTRKFPADGGAVAAWSPSVPVDGTYAVYVAWDADSGNAPDAHYRFVHPGGVIDRTFDQTVHGSTWQYVDTLWLYAGATLQVELIGDSATSGRFLSADAVRVGGGMGVVSRHNVTTGRPRWEEGAILATQFNGAPQSVYDPYDDGNGSDPSSRALWAAWEHPTGEDAVYLSWHSNACNGCDARGTSTYTYAATGCASGPPVTGSVDMADNVHDEIVSMATALWDASWVDRGLKTDCFSENNPSLNPEMPSALVELAFHDTAADTRFLKDPGFRRDASRAMYRGIARYYADRDGTPVRFAPEPPVDLGLVHGGDGRLVLSWAPGVSGDPFGDAPVGYRAYTSPDGRVWDGGIDVTGLEVTLPTSPGDVVYAKVVATNAGGWSFPSDIVAARRSPDGTSPVLIVAAFDRFDSGLLDWENLGPGIGTIVKMDVTRMNRGDVAVAHARGVDALGWPFETVSTQAFDRLDVADYRAIVWAAGEESTADETFSAAQQAKIRAYWEGGGVVIASGAEILWDLDERGTGEDRTFALDVLGAALESDDADADDALGEELLDGLDLAFGSAEGGPYPVEYPDVLDTTRTPIATYGTGGTAAAMGDRVALFGFPLEAIGDDEVRDEVIARLLERLVPDYLPPPLDTGDPGDTDTDTDTDTDVPIDTGGPADTDPDVDTDDGAPGAGGPGSHERRPAPKGCGCGTVDPSGVAGVAAAFLMVRRYRWRAGARSRSV